MNIMVYTYICLYDAVGMHEYHGIHISIKNISHDSACRLKFRWKNIVFLAAFLGCSNF